jgi:hypothetical protein
MNRLNGVLYTQGTASKDRPTLTKYALYIDQEVDRDGLPTPRKDLTIEVVAEVR